MATGKALYRRMFRMVVPFAAAACFVQVASAVTAVHDAKDGWKFFRDGADAPFAEMAEPCKDIALSVRAAKGASFVFIDVAPAAGDADRVAGVVSLPDIRLRRFSASPVKMGSAGLGRMDDGVVSCGYLAIAEPRARRGVVTAWLTNLKASGAFDGRQDAEGRVVVTPIADYGPMLVKANRRQVADTFVVGEFDDCRLGLEAYADAVAERFAIRLPPNETGYCTWCSDRYGYSDRSVSKRGCGAGTEASTAEFAVLAAKTLKPYGFDFIQFDAQWQAGDPDLNGPARDFTRTDPKGPYPDGFGKTVALLHEKGFRAGLWFIPFGGVADDPAWAGRSNLFVRSAVEVPKTVRCSAYRQPLVLARRKGDPIKTEWGGECLDMTKPEARAYLEDIVRRFTYDWGFRYLKTDGIFTGFGCDLYGGYAWKDVNFANAVFSDPEASNVSAFREGFQTMRRAAAPGTFILGCNLGTIRAMVPSFGLVDGMRIGNDNGPIDLSPKSYIEGPKAGSCRYFLNGRVWWADPDSTYVRAAVPLGRARSMASWTALTDSLFEVGDWLPDLPEERVEILRRTMAHHGSTSVRPIDYFESEIPTGWILDGGKHKVLGVFNWDTNAALKVDWPFAYAGLDATKKYVGFDFWRKKFIPPFSGAVKLEVPPDDCRVIALAEVGEGETVVSTSLHVAAPIYGTRRDEVLTIAGEPLEVRTYSASAGFRKIVIPAGAGGWRGALATFAGPSFQAALPVWPEGRATRMNDFVAFHTSFDAKGGERPILRVTGSSVYRIRLNGEFAGYGPARAAKGFFRVDEWPLAAREGRNDLTVEVSAYNCNNYYIPEWPGFLQAEVVADGRMLAATGRDFGACEMPRVTKCSRFSFQRAFGEAYRLALGCKGEPLTLGVQPAVPLVERIAPLPDFPVTKLGAPIISTKVQRKEQIKYRPIRSVDNHEPTFKLYEANTLDVNIWKELQHVEVLQSAARSASAPCQGKLQDGNGFVFDVGFNETGFPGLTVSCTKPGRLWMAFDEILQDGKVNPLRYGVANGVVWDLQPGRYRVEAFEPYTFRYLHVFALGGEFQVEGPYVRGYKNPDAKKASFTSSDPALDKIFAAARESFAQNAVDVFTDCPSRERAGWLCDSFFTGRSNLLFTGNTDLERLFIQNYLLPKSFPELPDGALPMCYPSDHPNHNFIPNWAMWFVIELDEYLARSGDRATVDAMKPRLVKLIDYLKTFRNSDGLLEKLPSWVFVEWSEANKLVRDVNYPSNMTWAEVLDCMDRLYGMPELAAEAKQVRETVRKQSWTGRWFCDNAVRQKDGMLKLSGKCTETCQYYAFMFKTATPELYPELWKTLLSDFGPKRKETKKHPEIYFSNAFIGNYLRLELLSRAGLGRQLLGETKGYFSFMAERTGTLWENDTPHASCNHGFASHAAVFYVKNVLGISAIDARAKTVKVAATDVPLESCSATLPVPGGAVTYGWTKKDGKTDETFTAPSGWRLVR